MELSKQEISDRTLAFSVGVDMFCKEAGKGFPSELVNTIVDWYMKLLKSQPEIALSLLGAGGGLLGGAALGRDPFRSTALGGALGAGAGLIKRLWPRGAKTERAGGGEEAVGSEETSEEGAGGLEAATAILNNLIEVMLYRIQTE